MKSDEDELDARIQRLLADPQYQGHPLREALDGLWQRSHQQMARIERITYISDAYQAMARERELSINERFERQLKRIGKVARISDRYQEMMRDLNEALREASHRDPLTGLYNRRMVMERLREETAMVAAGGSAYAIAMIDVDHFKSVNDRYGHEAGDRVLVEIAQALAARLKGDELCARWGGEEFVLILPATTLEDARTLAENLRSHLRTVPLPIADQSLWLTISVGVAHYEPGENFSAAIDRADRALYRAKQLGRDRVEIDDGALG
ncbi:biofilm regulation diguanylate cyclase SiaD [Orrella sp. JC864]|uniref:biofilm regulation diguanylate cyclase SiaD n=1 Tax=Orrella sp. JC864 TaxID=3120298 RepID=UPI00300B6CB9